MTIDHSQAEAHINAVFNSPPKKQGLASWRFNKKTKTYTKKAKGITYQVSYCEDSNGLDSGWLFEIYDQNGNEQSHSTVIFTPFDTPEEAYEEMKSIIDFYKSLTRLK